MTRRTTYQVWAIVALLAMATGCGKTVELRTTTAEQLITTIAQSQGENAVLVNFWATWCVPCVEEFPMIVKLGNSLADDGLITYFVSVDFIDERAAVVDFLKAHGVNSLSFIKDQSDMPFINGIAEDWTGAVPFTVVYGRNSGQIVATWEGKAKLENFAAAARIALAD